MYIKIAMIYFYIFLNVVYFFEGKTEFSAWLLQSLVPHDTSEIILI